jgi:hypothetical protein
MRMAIDQAGQYGGVVQVDCDGVFGSMCAHRVKIADFLDASVADEDTLAIRVCGGADVEDPAGLDQRNRLDVDGGADQRADKRCG